MKSFNLKIRLIYIPFLLIAVGFILIYSLLNAGLTIQKVMIPLKEEITDLWVPLVLPFILLAIWLRPRIRFLNLKTRRQDNLSLLYLIVAGLAIGAPASILQHYLRTAMGKLTHLQSISQIRENQLTKYYTADHFYIDTSLAAFKGISKVSGKHDETLNFAIYIACPIFDRKPEADTSKPFIRPVTGIILPQAWACLKYTKQVSNKGDALVKKEKWKTFALATADDFYHKDLSQLVYFDRIGNTDDRDYFEKDIINNPYISSIPGPLLIMEPKFTPFEERNGNKLAWVFGSFAIGALIWLIMITIPKLEQSVMDNEDKPLIRKKGIVGDDLKEVATLLLPRHGYITTPVIIDLNLLIFVLMVLTGKGFINFQADDLLTWGANYRPLTAGAGQWWRLLTNTFLHAGIMHLLFNMVGLSLAGISLEPALGKMRIAVVYLLTGVTASLTSLWWHPGTVSIGASGAIFGLYGVFLALLTTRYFSPAFKKSFTIGVLIFVGGNLLMGLAGGIDNAAHIGGLISGLIVGYVLYPRLKVEKEDSALQNESL